MWLYYKIVNLTTHYVVINWTRNDMDIKKELEHLGLSKNHAEIYLLLLQQGELRISEIVQRLQIPRSSVYENLRGLFTLGLAEEVAIDTFKRLKAYPVTALRHSLEEKITRLQQQAVSFGKLEKSLALLSTTASSAVTQVRYFKGVAGARQLFWNTLKAKSDLYVYSEFGRSKFVGKKFYMDFVEESFKRNLKEKVITNPTDHVIGLIKRDTGTPLARTNGHNIRTLSENQIRFKGDTFMYDNIYTQVYLDVEEINGFEIESKQFVETQRAIFETLWQTALPVMTLL